jgi:superfamily II RNA helicase
VQIDPQSLFQFPLDDFQLEAMRHLEDGKSVVVCAPTGAGKTVVAEYAVEMALMANKRCFYTTPLKALSNQKLYDLRKKYGEDKVGLLTGDLSINRDASIVVMTTEVFRNMLYGTILGDVSRNLKDVASVVLDECHYMNDTERGTVWEEAIIYAPKDIQLVGLSATVANARELTTWIDETHGPTELVISEFRPVPLRFHYFGERRIYPLLSPGGGVNNFLKSQFGKKRPQRPDERRRKPMGGLYTHPADVLATLSGRNMLPAIYFLFSRRGCEEAMKMARGIPLLQPEEQKELRRQVEEFTRANPNLANHPHLPYLAEGMSVHHAGMLPSWKGMIEKLFQRGLLKVVFATETLAAGINMPARSTVISSIHKRSDEGHRQLTASEFLQMSGRAGRRGMDDMGHVVVLHNPYETVDEAAKLATAPADPLSSRFTPSYGMVLNLLERHSIDDARDLIEHSFGQFLVSHQLEPAYEQKMRWEAELVKLRPPLCPERLGDLPLYAKRLEAIRAKHKALKQTERGLKPAGKGTGSGAGKNAPNSVAVLDQLRQEIHGLLSEAYAMPCHGCPVQRPCSNQTERVQMLEKRIHDMDKRIQKASNKYWNTFEALANILRMQGYLDGNTPSQLGRMAASIRGDNELFLTEVAISGLFDNLQPHELAAILSALVGEEARGGEQIKARVSPQVDFAIDEVRKMAKKLTRIQREFDIDDPVEIGTQQCGLMQMWAQGASWDAIRMATRYDEGDVVRSIRRALDLCRQYIRAKDMPEKVVELCSQVEILLNRDEVREDF